jgi:ribosomal protein S18 acetylase RimI-like enzyme
MAAVPPRDRDAFLAHWAKIQADETTIVKSIIYRGRVAGNIVHWQQPGEPKVGYWIGKEYWGRGIASTALSLFLRLVTQRPLYARVAKHNVASIRVLQKCGFTIVGEDTITGAGGEAGDEFVLELRAAVPAFVTVDRIADLSDADREGVRRLSLAVYPPGQAADWPGRHVEWSAPEWCVRIRDDQGTLVSYAGVYVREAECGGRPVRVGGVGNVKTHPGARGRGLAALGVRRAVEFFREQPTVAFALLVCEPQLLGYYARLGWREFGGRLLVRQHGAACEFTLDRVMTHGVRSEAPVAGTIDLCGPPW